MRLRLWGSTSEAAYHSLAWPFTLATTELSAVEPAPNVLGAAVALGTAAIFFFLSGDQILRTAGMAGTQRNSPRS